MSYKATPIPRGLGIQEVFADYAVLFALVVVLILGCILAPSGFASIANMIDILDNSVEAMLLSMGLAMVLMVGEFDLSFPHIVGLSSVIVATLYQRTFWSVLPIIIVLLAGLVFGVINGLIVGRVGLPAYFATIASGSVAYGIGMHMCGDGKPVRALLPYWLDSMRNGTLGPIPSAIPWLIVVALAFKGFISHTRAGNRLYACGDAPLAATSVGIRVLNFKVLAYAISGFTAALVGVFVTVKAGAGLMTVGPRFLLPTLAGTFLGATMFTKKRLTIVGVCVGVIFVETLKTALVYLGYPFYFQDIITGAVLLLGALGSLAKARFV